MQSALIFIENYHDIIDTAATLLIALFTFTLWRSTKHLWRTTERQLGVAERSLIELERPYVFVTFGTSGFEIRSYQALDPATQETSIEFTSRYDGMLQINFENFGRSPAILVELLDTYDWVAGHTAMPYPINPTNQVGKKLPAGLISVAGQPYQLAKLAFHAFGGKHLNPNSLFVDRLFCLGYMRYEDILGGRYILGYCGYFDSASETFVLEGGPEYNYFRVESDARAALVQRHKYL